MELCVGCNRSPGMVLDQVMVALEESVVLEELALALAHHHCTMVQRHWHQRFRCRSGSWQRTGGTNQCYRHRNQRSLPRIYSNLLRLVALVQERVAWDHHWR